MGVWKKPIWAVMCSNDAASSPLYPISSPVIETPSLRFLSILSNDMLKSEPELSSFSISSFVRMSVGLVIERENTVKSATDEKTRRTASDIMIVENVEWYFISAST